MCCYIDDILRAETNDHLKNLEEVLKRLAAHGITVKKGKYKFLSESVEYLGHIIDKKGLHAAQSKVQAIVEAHIPTCVKELRSFLGLLNYYGRFIKNLASVIHPLNSLLKQNSKWVWAPECAQASQRSYALSPSFGSAYGVGAVQSQTRGFRFPYTVDF